MMGKIMAGAIVIIAAIAGVSIYYLQIYAFYEPVVANGTDDVQLTNLVSELPETVPYDNFEAIDADSSPIRYRACFTTTLSPGLLTETYEGVEYPVPLVAPDWFSCFDAKTIGKDLEDANALAFMGTKNITYGVDRIVAIYPDGRGYAWNEINACGEKVFDGLSAPEGCPIPPEDISNSRTGG
ncbi:MAG: DUF6446 family protein [Rhodobacterales bacterium]|nr:DUF6446 family protein [Rhodobacterales bacterium]